MKVSRPLYMGKWASGIGLVFEPDMRNYYYWDLWAYPYEKPDLTNVQLLLDSTRFITGYVYIRENDGYAKRGVRCYPVMLGNTSSDTLGVGYGSYMHFLQEGLDKDGQWEPIEDLTYTRAAPVCGAYASHREKCLLWQPQFTKAVTTPVYGYGTITRYRKHSTAA